MRKFVIRWWSAIQWRYMVECSDYARPFAEFPRGGD